MGCRIIKYETKDFHRKQYAFSTLFILLTPTNTSIIIPLALGVLLFIAIAVLIYFQFKIVNHRSKIYKLNRENEYFLNQINQLRESLLKRETEYNHLFQLNALNLKELENLKQELKKAKFEAEEADMVKSNFLANMSHEIRTPMNGILGFAQLLMHEEMEREQQQRYLDIVCHNGTMLVNLIDDIMDLSKIEANQLALNKTEVSLDDLIFDLYTFFNEIKFKQEKEHINIRILNLNDEESCMFYTDAHRLRQVMSNLIGNAIKFTEKGIVEFGYINNKENREFQFFVKDTGIGIPADKVNIIFDRFRQIEEGSTRKYGGTGIGLFISKHVVDMLGGKIWVESDYGQGSSFYFTLPYETVKQKDKSTTVFSPSKKNYIWKNRVIVIAEDVETNYKFLKAILKDTEANIVWVRDGEEVIEFCKTNPNVDVVLMDIQMPKVDGYEATRQIKRFNPNIFVLAQTAYAMPNDNLKCIEAGCNDYISKPINSNLLLEKIDTFLALKTPK